MLKTALFDWHVARSARMVAFGGWEMPIQYSSVVEEHLATRTAIGLTDVSHMGRLTFEGADSCRFLDTFLSRDVTALKPGQVRYSLITNSQGGIVDDVLIGLFTTPEGGLRYVLVVNASNRPKVLSALAPRLAAFRQTGGEVRFDDTTERTAMFAIQGPQAVTLMQPLVDADLASMKYYNGAYVRLKSPFAIRQPVLLTRTGYTGEDGFEMSVEAADAPGAADILLDAGKPLGLLPVGLGARDTLRLEAGMPLYGHEMNEETDPFEAGLAYACCLSGADFPGRDALLALSQAAPKRVRVGLELTDKRPAREGCPILSDSTPIGTVSSGSFAPTLGKPVAMGFVPPEYSSPGQLVQIDIRGKMAGGRVVPLPFYKRK